MRRLGVPTDFLQAVVLLANEVSDFEKHLVHLFDRKTQRFVQQWHFLRGYEPEAVGAVSQERQAFLRELLLNRQTVRGKPLPPLRAPRSLDPGSLVVPLYLDARPVGLLALWPPEGQYFGEYDAYLADCIAQVAATGFACDFGDYLTPLRFMVLHRRHSLTAAPKVSEVAQAYLERIVGKAPYAFFSGSKTVSANFRMARYRDAGSKHVILSFSYFAGDVSDSSKERLSTHEVVLSEADQCAWLHSWAESDGTAPPDIDMEYRELFPEMGSHIGVPCCYRGDIYGILSLDSRQCGAFDRMTTRAICILGAQMAPLLANAQARADMVMERTYLEKVIDAIPDELLIVDRNARIIRMNKVKAERFPAARIGQYCYRAFEIGKEDKCRGCYTLHTLETGKPVQQALWEYTDRKTKKKGYVEISSGRIELPDAQIDQAVEIVRRVDMREGLLEWMADAQGMLLAANSQTTDDEEIPTWLARWLGEGLTKMGVPRYRIYKRAANGFQGLVCHPEIAFSGGTFSEFFLDCDDDTPSRVLIEDKKMRPIRFSVGGIVPEGPEYMIPENEGDWNYVTCRLRDMPPKCAAYLGKRNIRSWIDIPLHSFTSDIGDHQVVAKVTVDWGDELESSHGESETAHEMALLSAFGRFSSVAIGAARNHKTLLRVEREKAILQIRREAAAQFAHMVNNKLCISQYRLDKTLRLGMSRASIHDLEIAKQMVDRVINFAFNFKRFSSRPPLAPIPVTLCAFLDHVIRHCRVVFDNIDFALDISLERDLTQSLYVRADIEAFQDVFEMLVVDSKRFHPTHGPAIKVGCIIEEGGTDSSTDTVNITYEDNGPGVPDNRKERIFELLYTSSKEGSGVGLSDVEEIVRLHGGTIVETGTEGRGARFEIRLPLRKEIHDESGNGRKP